MQHGYFDYFSWWKHAVKNHGIAPSEAWGLDYCELSVLTDYTPKSTQDGSFMVNAQRKMNGMAKEEIKNEY